MLKHSKEPKSLIPIKDEAKPLISSQALKPDNKQEQEKDKMEIEEPND